MKKRIPTTKPPQKKIAPVAPMEKEQLSLKAQLALFEMPPTKAKPLIDNFYVEHIKKAAAELVALDKCIRLLETFSPVSGTWNARQALITEKERLVKRYPIYKHAMDILENVRTVNRVK